MDSLILSTVSYYDRTIVTPTKNIKIIKDSITGMEYESETGKRDTIYITKHKKLNSIYVDLNTKISIIKPC